MPVHQVKIFHAMSYVKETVLFFFIQETSDDWKTLKDVLCITNVLYRGFSFQEPPGLSHPYYLIYLYII